MGSKKFSLKYFNKEIYLLRLAITTNCILRCHYCFVKKNNKVMTYYTAIKAINLLLNSPGKEKIVIIYGGEPLLYFELLKKVIIYARNNAKLLKKNLIISLGTNGILLNQKQLDFFRSTGVKLSISLDGQESFHNKGRVFPNGEGSFSYILEKISLIIKKIKKENLCILFGVLPSSVYSMNDNLIYLTTLGFDSINIEPVQSKKFKWNYMQKKVFLLNLIKFIQYIYINIFNKNFIFLNTVNRELKNNRLTSLKRNCPFYGNLEVYPQGEMAFSPFLINSKDRNQYIIGNIKEGLPKKYRFCNYNPRNERCRNCWQDYNRGEKYDLGRSNDILKLRNIYSLGLAKKISSLSKEKFIFKKYIREAKKRIFE